MNLEFDVLAQGVKEHGARLDVHEAGTVGTSSLEVLWLPRLVDMVVAGPPWLTSTMRDEDGGEIRDGGSRNPCESSRKAGCH